MHQQCCRKKASGGVSNMHMLCCTSASPSRVDGCMACFRTRSFTNPGTQEPVITQLQKVGGIKNGRMTTDK